MSSLYFQTQNCMWYSSGVQWDLSGGYPLSTVCAPLDTAQNTVGLPCCQRYPWLMFNLVSTNIHRSFCHKVLPQPVQLKGVPPSQVLDLLFVFCLVRFLSAHSSSLSGSIQMVALSLSILFCSLSLPPVWLPPANFNSNHSTASFRSLIKMLNGTDSRAVPCGTAVG